jgi:hypothetical protein
MVAGQVYCMMHMAEWRDCASFARYHLLHLPLPHFHPLHASLNPRPVGKGIPMRGCKHVMRRRETWAERRPAHSQPCMLPPATAEGPGVVTAPPLPQLLTLAMLWPALWPALWLSRPSPVLPTPLFTTPPSPPAQPKPLLWKCAKTFGEAGWSYLP